MKLVILLIFIYFYIMYLSKNIEPFLGHIDMDDFQYIPSKGIHSNNMLNNYYINVIPEIEKQPGFLSDIYDYMGIDSHHYLFEAPHRDDNNLHEFDKSWEAYYGKKEYDPYGRPITYPSETQKYRFLENQKELDSILINEPHQYRHPKYLGNKIVYDFSNSLDFQQELRERELRLRGFRRTTLNEEDDYLSMTFCTDVDEEGNDFPCHEFGLEYNYEPTNQLKLAKYRDPDTHDFDVTEINNYSANICCKR